MTTFNAQTPNRWPRVIPLLLAIALLATSISSCSSKQHIDRRSGAQEDAAATAGEPPTGTFLTGQEVLSFAIIAAGFANVVSTRIQVELSKMSKAYKKCHKDAGKNMIGQIDVINSVSGLMHGFKRHIGPKNFNIGSNNTVLLGVSPEAIASALIAVFEAVAKNSKLLVEVLNEKQKGGRVTIPWSDLVAKIPELANAKFVQVEGLKNRQPAADLLLPPTTPTQLVVNFAVNDGPNGNPIYVASTFYPEADPTPVPVNERNELRKLLSTSPSRTDRDYWYLVDGFFRNHEICPVEDFAPGSYKGSCDRDSVVAGISRNGRILCRIPSVNPSRGVILPLAVRSGETQEPGRGDWAPQRIKRTCPVGHYLNGLSYKAVGGSSHLAPEFSCAPSPLIERLGQGACNTRWFDRDSDNRGSDLGDDWATGILKGQCTNSEYVAGFALRHNSLNEVGALLCCSFY